MAKKIAYISIGVLALLAIIFIYRFYSLGAQSESTEVAGIGLVDGQLAACGDKPNCVSSTALDEAFRVEGFKLPSGDQGAFSSLIASLVEGEGVKLVKKTEEYAHLTFRSQMFGFIDDLQLLFNVETGKVELRSSSRVGYSDLGANRKRVEAIRKKILDAQVPK